MPYKRVSKKFLLLSEKYHKLSLLFYELSKSIEMEGRKKTAKEFKSYIKTLNLDINKIIDLSQDIKNLEIGHLKKV